MSSCTGANWVARTAAYRAAASSSDATIFDALDAASAARAAGEAEPYPRAERLAERYESVETTSKASRAGTNPSTQPTAYTAR